ncbi:hypothetical protein [Cellulomonas edaphi]|uniref:Uncharacterized protein n=1 Tax=Cellulomonas edaphi TaxID=3053468 RepID=A0ABT7S9N1_9CELL|nr:hypothetical protein [Cellulomons edaphi]MDM7832315.1 hypothetical protein [Cellulomons edaphi]
MIGADRATWVRLAVALAVAGCAAAAPHVGWTSAEFTRSTQTGAVVRTAPDFAPAGATPSAPEVPSLEAPSIRARSNPALSSADD